MKFSEVIEIINKIMALKVKQLFIWRHFP